MRLPGHRPFLSTVLRIRDDGTVDVVDPRRAVRTLRPETLTPANRPKVIPAHVKVPGR